MREGTTPCRCCTLHSTLNPLCDSLSSRPQHISLFTSTTHRTTLTYCVSHSSATSISPPLLPPLCPLPPLSLSFCVSLSALSASLYVSAASTMAFPILFPLPSMSSSRVSTYPSNPPPVGIKLVEKKRWSVKRVLLLFLTAVAGYDFCNEFSLGAGTKGPPVRIAPKAAADSKSASWRERSLALLRFRAARKAPPLPPPAPTTASTTTTATTTAAAPAVTAAVSVAPVAVVSSAAGRPAPSRPLSVSVPGSISAVPVREAVLLPSTRRSSVSTSSVYWQATDDGGHRAVPARQSADSDSKYQQPYQQQLDSKERAADWDESTSQQRRLQQLHDDGDEELSTLRPSATSPFVHASRPWLQQTDGFTQLVEA